MSDYSYDYEHDSTYCYLSSNENYPGNRTLSRNCRWCNSPSHQREKE